MSQNLSPAPPVPIENVGPGDRYALHTPEFAQDPHQAYRHMRKTYGSLVPIWLAPGVEATLVIGYELAVNILGDHEHFPADPRTWERAVPANCPILPMVGWRPNALRSSGETHSFYRAANQAALDGIDQLGLREQVIQTAEPLINTFCGIGTADVISDYLLPLVFSLVNKMLGCPDDIGEQVRVAMAAMFESTDTAHVNEMLGRALGQLIAMKRTQPGNDITTRLLTHQPPLSDEEMVNQVITLYGAGIEPTVNLIANTLLMMLTDDRFVCGATGFGAPTIDAINDILVYDPPMANYCLSFPPQPINKGGVWLPANKPVVISMAACNNDPAVNNGEFLHADWGLAFSTGNHACPKPARIAVIQIACTAIGYLFDALPELTLARSKEQLVWRPGPFHRALVELPVTFPKSPPLPIPAWERS
ncbi:cytochrome P450 [Nocardia sp. NPDC049526]|uniref:cytochrome P450 n=1 Tax=Nocardia sp. NPDC049526 TaxID=3364316 RepID=UPI0037B99CF2